MSKGFTKQGPLEEFGIWRRGSGDIRLNTTCVTECRDESDWSVIVEACGAREVEFERIVDLSLQEDRNAVKDSVNHHHVGAGHHVCCRCQKLLLGALVLPASVKCWACRDATCTKPTQISGKTAAPKSRPAGWPAYTRTSVTREALRTEFRPSRELKRSARLLRTISPPTA